MSKKTLWVVTGALGIVGLGAGVASAGGNAGGDDSFEQSPAVQVSNLDTSPSAPASGATIDLTTTPPTAIAGDGTAALTHMTSNTSITSNTSVSTVSPVSPVSVQSPISAESSS